MKLTQVVAEQVSRMRMAGLKGTPFISDEHAQSLQLEVYLDALREAGYTDKNAASIARIWRGITNTVNVWVTPRELRVALRNQMFFDDKPAIENKSNEVELTDEQKRSNLLRLGHMMKDAFSGKLVK